MIFEIMENANDEDTVTVIMDNNTFNQILMMLIIEAYHKGQNEKVEEE